MRVPSLGWEEPLEEGMATHSSILAQRIPWTEEPSGVQFKVLQSQTRLSTQNTEGLQYLRDVQRTNVLFFFFNNFIYIFLLFSAVLVLCCCTGFSLVVESGSYSLAAVLGFLLQCLLLLRAQALGCVGSEVAA